MVKKEKVKGGNEMININLKNIEKLLISKKVLEDEDFIPNHLMLLGRGVECKAYAYKDICIKDYGDEEEAYRQLEAWKKCGKSKLFPRIYGVKGRYLIMERIIGDLMEYVEDEESLELAREELKKFAKEQIDKGVVPYDLHPCNVMLSNTNEIKIIDVGYFSTLEEEELDKDEAIYSLSEDYETWYTIDGRHSYSPSYSPSCESSWM